MAAALVLGGCAYYLLVLVSVRRVLKRRSNPEQVASTRLSFSVLKPLAGNEAELAENLDSFFCLDHGDFELIFAAREDQDPGLEVARSLSARHPSVRARHIAVGEPACPNAKVHSLAAMARAASGDVLVISDSDIRTRPSLLKDLAADFASPHVGVVTCPYRAVPGPSPWSLLEALGMNTEFWGGVLTAQHLMPMDFAVGPTMAIRRSCLEAIGHWSELGEYLAEDFRIGRLARQHGFGVRLGTHVVDHRIGSEHLGPNLAHRLRWRRSTRRSRPVGYWGELLTNPLPWAVALLPAAAWAEWAWWLLGACAALRFAAAAAVGRWVLGDPLVLRHCWLIPVQDVLSLAVWVAGLFGNRITWRDRDYVLTREGRMRLRKDRSPQNG